MPTCGCLCVAQVILRTVGDYYYPAHAGKILCGEEWTRETPDRRARERNEATVEQWGMARWP